MTKSKYTLIRFNIEFGPPSLFERVKFKMKDVTTLYLDGQHFKQRLSERNIPQEVYDKLKSFSADEWQLRTAEVRSDKGKFINSTWEIELNECRYWVTIGLGNFIQTIVVKDTSGVDKCVRSGEFYDFVEQVNRALMDEDLAALEKSKIKTMEQN